MDTTVNEWQKDYKIENAKVTNVSMSREQGKNCRIVLTLDTMFKSYDFKTSEKIETNKLSLDIANVGLQCANVPQFKRANRYLLGANLTPIIIACVLDGATISIDRVFKKKGEKRESGNDVYTSDLFKSVITHVVPNMDEYATQDFNDAIAELKSAANKAQTQTTTTTTTSFGLIW